MKQLISRIEDDLHRRLKEVAAREHRSVNDLVIEVLGLVVNDDAASVRRRLNRSGLRIIPPRQPDPPPSLESVLKASRGVGVAVSEALQEERSER